MANLTDLISDEQFEAGEEQRFTHREQQYLTSIEHIPEIHKYLTFLIPESLSNMSDYEFANRMVDASCIRKYYQETHKPEKLAEIAQPIQNLLERRTVQFGKLGTLFYEHRELIKQEFIETLKQDLEYVEQHENDQGNTKTNAAKHLWQALEFANALSLSKLAKALELQHKNLMKYYLLKRLYWPK